MTIKQINIEHLSFEKETEQMSFEKEIELMATKPIKCDYCPKTFDTISAWRRHINREMQIAVSTCCKHCDTNCMTTKKLGLHIKRRSCRGDIMAQDKCKYCDKLFTTSKYLNRHITDEQCLPKNGLEKWIVKFISNDTSEELFTPEQAAELDLIEIKID